jgi:nicotinamide-nucleotide amidase
LADAAGERVEAFRFSGDRGQIRLRSACTAIDWLRRYAIDRLNRDAESPLSP